MPGITSAASLASQVGPTSFVTTDAGGHLATAGFSPTDISTLNSNVAVLQQGVRQAFEALRLAQQLRSVERHRRRDLRRHDETAVRPITRATFAKPVLECRGEGAANGLVVHYLLSFAAARVCSLVCGSSLFGTGRAAPTALI